MSIDSNHKKIISLAPAGEYSDVELWYDHDEHCFFNHYDTMGAVRFIEKLAALDRDSLFIDTDELTLALHDYYKHNAY